MGVGKCSLITKENNEANIVREYSTDGKMRTSFHKMFDLRKTSLDVIRLKSSSCDKFIHTKNHQYSVLFHDSIQGTRS